jgi:hypothetical protein
LFWIGFDLRYTQPIRGPSQIVSHDLPLFEITRLVDLTHENDELKRERHLSTALGPNHAHAIARKKLTDDSVMKEVLSFTSLLNFVCIPHMFH